MKYHIQFSENIKLLNFEERYGFYTVSDLPGSSGLGSSSFTVGLIKILDKILGVNRSKKNLAQTAIFLEREI